MPYLSGYTMVQHAWKNGYAIGAFSAHNAETIRAILLAAEQEQAPIMIQVGQKVISVMGLEPMKAMIDAFMQDITVPVCVHLDHSRSFAQTMQAVQARFQSVMFDGSHLSFDENVRITRAVADVAHALNIGVEGEIGKIGGTEDDISVDEKDALITTSDEALKFSELTTVDYLAVSIGTAHGLYKQEPRLAFERLHEIREIVRKPIVLHGGSGVPDEQIRKAVALGVAKINVDTELRQAFTLGVAEVLNKDPEEFVLAVSLGRGRDVMKERVVEKIRLFGSHGKAVLF
ncbi:MULTISPECIES: class II fructose-bisphosphate aldolase [unclassified Serratia (in: enterobacteria)]|uniref:class II fructose-bisphosphate aldolase n=1 Tax=unclassified Serratia (in: enterobacteria) TaxID=2647522 RepID=UPI000508A18B|nr:MULTISPECIES: class II fructose-bisphosphate aldolase [unclassified Serratia (in: enterobacteria)]KFK92295.1 tagatose-bisphosphate aldolase [Serratia sp. Ag2]KFK96043.1 tagatose-bisphosphate aldolase [Serratia sp. Ag1]